MANNNEYMKNYLKSMNDSNLSIDEKFKLTTDYHKKYFEELDTSNIVYKFMRDHLRIELGLGIDVPQFEAEEFVKALSIINSTEKGNIKFLYFLNVLMKASEDILPIYPEEFMVKLKQLEISMDLIIKYGIDHHMINIDKKDMDILNNNVKVNHNEAAMEESEETSDSEKSKVEKETTKDKKEEDKKKKEENRKKTEKYFDYDSIDQLVPDLKKNKGAWYRVANRVAALLIQEDVQKLIGDHKFRLLIYQDGNDFAIINEQNNDIFWFMDKAAERYLDSNLFNMKWAEAHQSDRTKFTA